MHIAANTGRLLRARRRRARRPCAAAHRHRRLRRHRRARSAASPLSRRSRGGSSRPGSATSPARAISPMPCAASSRTAAGAAGSCGSPAETAATAALDRCSRQASARRSGALRRPAPASGATIWTSRSARRTRADRWPSRQRARRNTPRSLHHRLRRGTMCVSRRARRRIHKVVSDVDAVECSGSLWVNPQTRAAQLPYDTPLTGFDPARPLLIESVEYTLLVRANWAARSRLRRTLAGPGASRATARDRARSAGGRPQDVPGQPLDAAPAAPEPVVDRARLRDPPQSARGLMRH